MYRGGAGRLPQHIHMVGIGGIGLSAIARVLACWGYSVTGSDLQASAITRDLNALGVATFVGHAPEQIAGADLVVISSAVPDHNPEVRAARQAGVPVIKRQQLLADMMADRQGIAVAGTHGKTTTSAMIAVSLTRLGLDPTFIVGGIIAELGANAQAGDGPHFVIEADEYDRMFHGLAPQAAVVTNIEMDHPDCYRDLGEMREAFGIFLDHVPADGTIIACADSPELRRVLAARKQGGPRVLTYGFSAEADYVVGDVTPNARGGVDFSVSTEGALWAACSLGIPGRHNALNATAVLLVGQAIGVEREALSRALAEFSGVRRRFEIKGEAHGVLVIDDYAHHPTEIRATLAAARARYPGRRIWAVFQPHTYSRTEALLADFAAAFEDADRVIVTDIFAARSKEVATVSASDIVALSGHAAMRHIASLDQVADFLDGQLAEGDVLLTLGAGDGYLVGERLLASWKRLAP